MLDYGFPSSTGVARVDSLLAHQSSDRDRQDGVQTSSTEGAMNEDFKIICDSVLALHGKTLSHAAQVSVIEDLRLRYFYPDEHVAFVDRWDERGNVRRLIRKVLAHSKSADEIEKALEGLGTEKGRTVKVRYIEPLEADIELPQNVGER